MKELKLSELTPPLTLIEVGEYRCLVDYKAEIKTGSYFLANQAIRLCADVKKEGDYPYFDGDVWHSKHWKGTVIATNNPKIPIQQLEEVNEALELIKAEAEKLHPYNVITKFNEGYIANEHRRKMDNKRIGFMSAAMFGYNHHKSTHPFSEADLRKAFEAGVDNGRFWSSTPIDKEGYQDELDEKFNLCLQYISKEWMILAEEVQYNSPTRGYKIWQPVSVNGKWRIKK